ncbi:MAG: DMT family transporter [Chloroflexi bacterium]|nr:DMT family transporter [Chloroflexota bacterium]
MLGILFAILATVGWGIGAVFVRLGVQHMGTTTGTLISLISGLLMTLVVALALHPDEMFQVSLAAVVWFAIAGVFNFPLGRFFNYLSVARLGVARSTPLLSTSPMFAMAASVFLLGEQLTWLTALGTVLILAGVYLAMSERRA